MPDFYSQITTDDKTVEFQNALRSLCDKMMNEGGVTDPNKLFKLAQLRGWVDINLTSF